MGKKSRKKNGPPKKNLNKFALPLFSVTILLALTAVFWRRNQMET